VTPAAARNTITDVTGVRVGQAENRTIATGVTAVIFDAPAIASISIGGGAPGTRDVALLEPGMLVERVDALVLSGGSAFGLDGPGGVQAELRERGRGFRVGNAHGTVHVPIVPGAILFDLLNGGDKDWGSEPVYWQLGRQAAERAGTDVALGSAGAGFGATTANLKGGLGSASAITSGGFTVGAVVAVNAIGSATVGDGPQFWAAPYERDGEFGGLGWPTPFPAAALDVRIKGVAPTSTTIAVVATDAALSKADAKRVAIMAGDGLAKALRPTHASMDGDVVFAAATARAPANPSAFDLVEIGTIAADCLTRAIARGVVEAESLPFPGALPSWRDRFGRR
jgi:L-aminopeptidase/D-esterase-like protein